MKIDYDVEFSSSHKAYLQQPFYTCVLCSVLHFEVNIRPQQDSLSNVTTL